jgi:hypothetical protein
MVLVSAGQSDQHIPLLEFHFTYYAPTHGHVRSIITKYHKIFRRKEEEN